MDVQPEGRQECPLTGSNQLTCSKKKITKKHSSNGQALKNSERSTIVIKSDTFREAQARYLIIRDTTRDKIGLTLQNKGRVELQPVHFQVNNVINNSFPKSKLKKNYM